MVYRVVARLKSKLLFQEVSAAVGAQVPDQERVKQKEESAGGAERQDRNQLHPVSQAPCAQEPQEKEEKVLHLHTIVWNGMKCSLQINRANASHRELYRLL